MKTKYFHDMFLAMRISSLLVILFVGGVIGCAQTETSGATDTVIQVPSKTIDGPAPWTGLVLWSDNDLMDSYEHSIALEFQYFRYDEVASGTPSAGYTYDWTVVSTFLNQAKARGHHGILRFRDTAPEFNTPGLPAALRTNVRTAIYDEQIAGATTKTVVFPDWSDPNIKNFVIDFYAHFAAQFDQNPALAYVQVGFGLWGEYHLDFDNLRDFSDPSIQSVADAIGEIFPSKEDQLAILDSVKADFANTPWGISIDASDSDYTPFESQPAKITSLGFGTFDDSFLCDGGNDDRWSLFTNAAATCNGGEISYYTIDDQRNALAASGPNGVPLASAVKIRALTYLIGNDQPAYRTPTEISAAGKTMGYHLKIVSVISDSATTRVTIQNTGPAGIFFDLYPSTGSVTSSDSLKGLGVNQRKTCSIDVVYGGSLTFQSPRLLDGQVIPFDGN